MNGTGTRGHALIPRSSGNAHTKAYTFCEKVLSQAADLRLHKEHQALHRAHLAMTQAVHLTEVAISPSAPGAVPPQPG